LCLALLLGWAGNPAGADGFVYVSLSDEGAIVVYRMDFETGALREVGREPVGGGPAPMAFDPTESFLYVGQRSDRTISSFGVDAQTGQLTYMNTVPAAGNPVYVATDRSGRHLLSAYYGENRIAVHAIGEEGQLGTPATQVLQAGRRAHAIMADRSNRFVFVPALGVNRILQYTLDVDTGELTPNSPPGTTAVSGSGPRHIAFHGRGPWVYSANELNSTVTAYALDDAGTLTSSQTLSTLPEAFAGENFPADIHITPDSRYLYVSNRGHDSIAAFALDADTGQLTAIGHWATQDWPRAFAIGPMGHFLYVAGERSDSLATYRVGAATGRLRALDVIHAGRRPSWVAISGVSPSTQVTSPAGAPPAFALWQNSPNPFNPSTVIRYALPQRTRVHLDLYDLLGRKVSRLVSQERPAGEYSIAWDGTDISGRHVASGIYLARMDAGGYRAVRKLMLIR
jgi:6-phosphogluconolactonase